MTAARHVWTSLRPLQWIKNLFVLAPVFFAGEAGNPARLGAAVVACLAFCAMSGAAYLVNDVADRERDRSHPAKSKRPLASGELPLAVAVAAESSLALLALILGLLVGPGVVTALVAYGLLNVTYSAWLKHVVILDVFCIALGFVIRVLGGGLAVDVRPTAWLMIATFLLALFLALAKRRHELVLLENGSTGHRPVLDYYTPQLVDELISVVTPVTLITYLLYTLDRDTIARFGTDGLYATGIFVVFGIFRYLYLVHRRGLGGSPTELVVKDGPMVVAIVGWLVAFAFVIYGR